MKYIILFTMLALSPNAFAYKDGNFSCKNSYPDLPNNTYKIETIQLGAASLPYVEIVRYFKAAAGIDTATVKGIASVHSPRTGTDYLNVGNLSLEFEGDLLKNCK